MSMEVKYDVDAKPTIQFIRHRYVYLLAAEAGRSGHQSSPTPREGGMRIIGFLSKMISNGTITARDQLENS